MSVIENVSYGLNFSNFDKEEIKDRAYQGLELVGLKAYGNRLPSELSGGQQQRVAVARALVLEPQVLLFDEPLSNLDAKLRRQVREEIREIQQNLGLTVVYVTHDQEEALAVSDEIVVMHNAGVAQIGSPRDLYEAPANRFVADFIGEANIIPCEIISIKNEIAKIDISGFTYNLSSRGMSVGSAKLAVRPTRLILNAKTGIKMSVEKATYVGSRMEYTLNADFGKLFAVSENVDTPLDIGQKIIVGLDPIGPVLLKDN
jgi:iron(III) transport system ATP-binding protein